MGSQEDKERPAKRSRLCDAKSSQGRECLSTTACAADSTVSIPENEAPSQSDKIANTTDCIPGKLFYNIIFQNFLNILHFLHFFTFRNFLRFLNF